MNRRCYKLRRLCRSQRQDTLKVSGHYSVGNAKPQHLARVLALFREAVAGAPPDRKNLVGRPQIHRGRQRHHIRAQQGHPVERLMSFSQRAAPSSVSAMRAESAPERSVTAADTGNPRTPPVHPNEELY